MANEPKWESSEAPSWAQQPSGPPQAWEAVEAPPWAREEKKERSWSDVPLEAVKNIPGSALEFGKNIVQPILHPIDTAKSLGELGGGVLQHLGLMSGGEYKPAADAVGKFLMDRYGSIEGIKNTLATDPVGLAGDLSMVLTGGGSAAARAPGLIGKVGEVASTAGRYTNPLTPVGAVAAPVGRLAGRAAAEATGLTTHVGPEPYIQAAKAGYEGGSGAQAFREHITGAAPAAEPVADAQQVLAQLRNERGVAYRGAMNSLGQNYNQPLNFNLIDNALANSTSVHTFRGVPLDPPNVSGMRIQIAQAVQDWKMLPPNVYHTAEGLDALKKKIGGMRDSTQFGTPERVVANQAYNSIKQTIVNAAPEYARIMRGYEQASTRLNELQKELSIPTPDKGRVDTALRKLQSTLRNNVNTSFGRRKELADFLVRAGAPDLMYKLAGQALQPVTPRGLGKLAASVGMEIGAAVGLTGGAGAAALGPAALLAGTMSPRLMGEGAYWGGVGARRFGQVVPPRAAFPPAAAVGQIEDAEQRKQPSRQAGGGVPALGGTGGRSPGATTPAGAGAARQGTSQALSDGGAAGDQEADPSYETKLTPGEEHVFQSWKQKYAPQDSGEDYDFRGAFKAGAKPDPRTNHWVDTFKKPNHPTFSDQSQYAKDRPDLAGSWDGDTYIPPQGRAEGGEVEAQPQPASRERLGAALGGAGPFAGSPVGSSETTGGTFKTKAKGPAPLLRQDVVDQLRRHGINDKEVLAGWTEGWPHTVDSRATGGSVDYETGERTPIHYDPGDDTTFGSRFGEWDKTSEGKSVPRDEEDVDTTIMAPGQKMIDPLGHRGTRNEAGYYMLRGMAEGGSVEREDRWQSLPQSRNIEDRRGENLSIGQVIAAGNPYAYVNPYRTPRNRAPAAMSAHAYQEGGGVEEKPELPPALMEAWEKPGGFEESAARTRRRAPVREPDPASLAASQGRAGWKGMGQGMAEGLASLPERATHAAGELQRQGDVYDPGPALETAGWMLGARTPFMKQGDLGIFGGRGGKTANLEMLKRAEEMHAQGASPESIWNQTGWARGAEGKWRYHISDVGSEIKPTERIHSATSEAASRPSGYRSGTLEEIIHHPEFFKAYPQFKDMPASWEAGVKPGGGFTPPSPLDPGNYVIGGRNPKSVGRIDVTAPTAHDIVAGDVPVSRDEISGRRILLHEMQHGVQEAEGFAPGANPNDLPFSERQITNMAKKRVEGEGVPWELVNPLDRKNIERIVRHEEYEKYAGETEARNVERLRDVPVLQRPPRATEDVRREFQHVPADEAIAAGFKPKKGQKPFKPAVQARAEAPNILPSEFDRPLFDYSRMEAVPNVPQFGLPRIIPARGIPEHIMRLGDPRNMERTNAIVQMGMSHGGPEWYNTMPLRDRYIGEVGATKGPESHRSYLNYVGATSPRSPVPLNVSVASYYDMLAAQGRPFPQPVFRGGNWSMPRGQLPEGYGSLAQATNARNAQMIREQGGWPSWTHFEKPKPPSFTSNLLGNYQPVTSDVHNVSMLNLRGPQGNRLIMPPHPYYGYIEQLQQGPMGAGQFIGLAPAQYQASGWIPWAAGYRDVGRYGDVTGGSPKKLEAYSQPFIKVVEDRVKNKARELGWSPEQTLRAFLRKEIAIVGVPAAAIPLLQDHLQRADQGGT